MLFPIVGGIGLFLMGMVLLTDGLKAYAGEALKQAMVRFTGGPLKAFLSGTLVTALVQSSSATTVTVIGFVSAGLLTFPQAVSVVIGASLGTTCTGWIVSVLGFQVSLGNYAFPFVGIGAFMRLLGRGRWKPLGTAVAGFGLIFLGIETLRAGMQQAAGFDTLVQLPGGLFGHFLMVLVGAAMTVVMQSSSAAVATTLTALHTDSISFEQASALVIGAAIGTTVTGALAAIGANISAQRTALAHVVFNLGTGLIALLLLPFFLWIIEAAQRHLGLEPGAMSLAAFHTAFIALGVVMVLPFVDRYARAIEGLLPEKELTPTRHLDSSVLQIPAVALEATRRALGETACELVRAVRERLQPNSSQRDEAFDMEIHQSLDQIQQFFAAIPALAADQPMSDTRLAQMHAIDHLLRLQSHLPPPSPLAQDAHHARLKPHLDHTRAILQSAEAGLSGQLEGDWTDEIRQTSLALAELRRQDRPIVLQQTASGAYGPAVALNMLDTMRWLDRVGYHTWRICNYLAGGSLNESAADEPLAE